MDRELAACCNVTSIYLYLPRPTSYLQLICNVATYRYKLCRHIINEDVGVVEREAEEDRTTSADREMIAVVMKDP